MKLNKQEIVFISIFMTLCLTTLGIIIYLIDTQDNCWEKYKTENDAIAVCEVQHG